MSKESLVYIICHVASDTSQVVSSQPTRQCTCATNDHRLHPCYVPSQSQARHPSLTAFPPIPTRLRIPQTAPPRPLFHPKSKPHISTKYFYPPPLCPIAKMILWNVKGWVRNGHAQYTATQKGMKWRAADGKLLSARVIHENESGPTPTKPTPPRFICALHVPEPKLTDT